MFLKEEKQKIIEYEGNSLVVANPGTGKTTLLAYKYANLIKKGIKPEQILCLTFTEKAKKEMESKIHKVVKEQNISFDVSKLNVFTFHSYALDNIEESEKLSTNLLRYTIFRYIKDKQIMNYSDEYLIDKSVPKIENSIRYLKSFGITPDKIDIAKAKGSLKEEEKHTKSEMEKFTDDFIGIFTHYETTKDKGIDYADMLLKFIELRKNEVFDYVLIDELQDVNGMEADIAIRSCRNFFAVGDKKQAIFGFQGGSLLNFEKFQNSEKFILSENFRSTNEILNYAKIYFISKTKNSEHKEELKNLCNAEGKSGSKPVICEVSKGNMYAAACELVRSLNEGGPNGKTAIITRTNSRIIHFARELDERGINFSSTFLSASNDAKKHIINFLKGVLSSDVRDVKKAMFTPFFPCTLQEAFNISSEKSIGIENICEKIPAFRELREKIKTVEDVNLLFKERIIPVCLIYGRDYFSAGISMQHAYQEAISVLEDKSLESFVTYLQSAGLLPEDSDVEKGLILTTVHKAKGREFDNVIYIPSKTKNNDDFVDNVVKGLLKSKGIDVEEELEEENLRIDFVAFTRAKNKLFILADKINPYLNEYADVCDVNAINSNNTNNKISNQTDNNFNEGVKKAFNLFVSGHCEEAKKAINSKNNWIKEFVSNYFKSLEHISFSSLHDDAYGYFVEEILGLKEFSPAALFGSDVHKAIKQILSEEKYRADENLKPYAWNALKLIEEIKKTYPEFVEAEVKSDVQLESLGFDSPLKFKSKIDAIFKNKDKYLIVDWKTDRDVNSSKSSAHRQQLEIYKRIFSVKESVDVKNIAVAIGYVGLKDVINLDNINCINCELDTKQPAPTAFDTVSKKINTLLSWIKTPERFFNDFIAEKKEDDVLWKSVVEEYQKQ